MVGSKRVRMSDIASRAGNVSVATVSRALRNEPGVSPSVRERIRKAAAELSYFSTPDTTGRDAVVTPVVDTWFYSTAVAAIQGELRSAGLDLLLYCLENAELRREFYQRLALRRKVDAVIVLAAPLTSADREQLAATGCPVVNVGARSDGVANVGFDDAGAARKAVAHLIHQGHTRIGMIRTESVEGGHWDSDRDRYRGYRAQLAEANLSALRDHEISVPWGIDEGAEAMQRLLSLPDPPTAVFCHSDEIAAGALRALRHEAGLRVPESMSVIAIDNHPIADLVNLTTVEQPVRRQGAAAARAVVDYLRGAADLAETSTILPADRIVFRSSTGPPASTRAQSSEPAQKQAEGEAREVGGHVSEAE
ncbi:MAG: LacI family DNA-binding transcriptional regulator [Mycobacteriaceae bacterium]|nr:LacI family DNA-binding transcriptional regulator [Mycobacteriaceae bacterium]